MRSFLLAFLLLICVKLSAQWSNNPSLNNPVCNFAGSQTLVQMISDGAGGTICTWVDTRNGTQDVYAQRMNASGTLLWAVDGIAICNAASDQYSPKLVSDGSNGAIITWYDNRSGNYDIYAQRIDASGAVLWTVDGVAICTISGNQNAQQIIGDGAGGAIIVWSDGRVGGPNADINAQRIDASGAVLWVTGGASVCTASSLQNIPQLTTDGAGGAIIVWEDWRNFSQADIYAQRISFNGFASWAFNGIIICSEPNLAHQFNSRIVSDGSGGAIMCWQDQRNFSTNTDIYIQKVNASGTTQWTTNGFPICVMNGLQISQQIIPDGSGGAIIAWEDRRADRDIYAQRINTSGVLQWAANGIVVCDATLTQEEPQLTSVPSGTVFVWTDSRNGFQQDIYAQQFNTSGVALWAGNGVPIANESHSQSAAQLVPDGPGGAIIAWQDLRTTADYDIYSSKLFPNGTLPLRLLSFSAVKQGNDVLLVWETDNEVNSSHFDAEFSGDGITFTKLGEVRAKNITGLNSYSFRHVSPSGDVLFYRLKQVDIDAKFNYSKIIRVDINKKAGILLYPNPASNFFQLKNSKPGEIQLIQAISIDGKIVATWKANNQLQYGISFLNPGIYVLRVIKKDNTIVMIPFEKK